MAAPLLLRLQGKAAAVFVFVIFVTQALSSLPVHGRAISGGGCVASERDALLKASRKASWTLLAVFPRGGAKTAASGRESGAATESAMSSGLTSPRIILK